MNARNYLLPLRNLTLFFLVAQFYACQPTIALFSQQSYQQTTALKVDALKVMDLATGSYESSKDKVDQLQTNIDKAYEYEAHRPKNSISTGMWQTLKNPMGNLLGGFLSRWKQAGTLQRPFIDEAKKQVAEAFDKIAELESGKRKQ